MPPSHDLKKLTPHDILRNRYLNKSTAFTQEERDRLGLNGRLPHTIESLKEQVARARAQFLSYGEPINRYQFLRNLQDRNNVLFYALVEDSLEDVLPVIYTPTVGEACQKFSALYNDEHGLYITRYDKGKIVDMLRRESHKELDVVVITDGSRILGLGDLGSNGMGIPIGKISLYVAGAGLDPRRVLPITLDVGTNNADFREDRRYLGLSEQRCNDAEFYEVLDEFMEGMKKVFPNCTIQFEDFSNNHCFDMLSRYRSKYRCFNDDIQGTGAVVSAGFVNAVRLSGIPPMQHRIVVYGAGSAAVGVVDCIADLLAFQNQEISREDIIKSVYLVDTRGLVTTTRGDSLAAHKKPLARTDIAAADNAKFTNLWDTVQQVKPTALIGLAGAGPAFTKEMVEFVSQHTPRPIIFPLSNPTSKAEITAENAYKWTSGKAIVASGSPFPPVEINGKICKASQGNNMYVFPGIGLGAMISRCSTITDGILTQSAHVLASMVPPSDLENGLYPPLTEIRRVSAVIAAAVVMEAQREGIVEAKDLPTERAALERHAASIMWSPQYPPMDFYVSRL